MSEVTRLGVARRDFVIKQVFSSIASARRYRRPPFWHRDKIKKRVVENLEMRITSIDKVCPFFLGTDE